MSPGGWITGLLLGVGVCLGGCVQEAPAPATPAVAPGAPIVFSFITPDGTPISNETMSGRPTLIALVTTYDWASQLLLRRVNQTLLSHVPRVNALGVVLEEPSYSVLLDTFAKSLNLRFGLVMADRPTLAGDGPFAPLTYVPTLLVLDAQGRLLARLQGPVERAEIDAALEGATGDKR